MKLRTRTLAVTAITVAVLTGALHVASSYILLRGFERLEHADVEQHVQRARSTILKYFTEQDAPLPAWSHLDDEQLSRLYDQIHVRITAQPQSSPPPPNWQEAARALHGAPDGASFIRARGAESIEGYFLLSDHNGRPVRLLRVELPRVIYQQGLACLRYLSGTAAVVGLLCGLVALGVLEKLLLVRIRSLSRRASNLGASCDLMRVPADPDTDELSSLDNNLQAALEALCESQERLRITQFAVDRAADAVFWVAPDARLTYVNDAACRMLGYSRDELLSMSVSDIDPNFSAAEWPAHWERISRQGMATFESCHLAHDGRLIPVEIAVNPVEFEGGEYHCAFVRDITDRKRMDEHLRNAALKDALTGLPNRAMLQEHLQGLISRRRDRPAAPFAVMFLDFDRLKVINDSLGHHIGDQLLIAIGRRLQSCMQDEIVVPPTSTGQMVARLGGDEFVVVVEGVGSAGEASIIADRLQHRVAAPFSLQGHEAQVSASIGIVLSEAGHETPQALLRDADTAMYRAKGAGRARHVVFDRQMHAQAVRRLELERELRKAVDNRELYVMYQPLIALDSGEIEGFEALARWTHPQHGAISPDEFIAVAEETGLIVPIGRKILTDSCSWIRQAIALAPSGRPPSIGVNLSKRQLAAEDLISDVADILSRSGLPPENLILEVTESTIMEHAEVFTPVLRELKKLGLRLAMDDFGTGHSSLSCLHRFPVDILKIDRAFIGNMGQSAAGLNVEYTAIVQAVITLAHNLGMRVVAEGIELPAQLVQLQSLDCDYGQGFLFSQPLSTDAAIEFIRTRPGAGLAACQPPDLRRPFDAVERGASLS